MTTPLPPAASAPPWRPPATRPPLTSRAKRGAAIAGSVSFVALNIGFFLFGVPVVLGLFAALFTGIIGAIDRFGGGQDADFRRFSDGIDAFDLEQWVLPLVLVSILGAAIMVLALLASTWILKAHGIGRRWPITWSAAGIAVAVNVVIGGVISGGIQTVLSAAAQSTGDLLGAVVVSTVVSGIVALAINATIGWLAWWWMVATFRPRDQGAGEASADPYSAWDGTVPA